MVSGHMQLSMLNIDYSRGVAIGTIGSAPVQPVQPAPLRQEFVQNLNFTILNK